MVEPVVLTEDVGDLTNRYMGDRTFGYMNRVAIKFKDKAVQNSMILIDHKVSERLLVSVVVSPRVFTKSSGQKRRTPMRMTKSELDLKSSVITTMRSL